MQGLSAELSTTESEDFHSALPATVFPGLPRHLCRRQKQNWQPHNTQLTSLHNSSSRLRHHAHFMLQRFRLVFPASHHITCFLVSHHIACFLQSHPQYPWCTADGVLHTLCRCPRAWWPLLPSLSMQSACMQGRADIPKFSSHAVYGQIMVPSSKFTEHAVASKFQIHRACSRICRLQKACSLPIPNS